MATTAGVGVCTTQSLGNRFTHQRRVSPVSSARGSNNGNHVGSSNSRKAAINHGGKSSQGKNTPQRNHSTISSTTNQHHPSSVLKNKSHHTQQKASSSPPKSKVVTFKDQKATKSESNNNNKGSSGYVTILEINNDSKPDIKAPPLAAAPSQQAVKNERSIALTRVNGDGSVSVQVTSDLAKKSSITSRNNRSAVNVVNEFADSRRVVKRSSSLNSDAKQPYGSSSGQLRNRVRKLSWADKAVQATVTAPTSASRIRSLVDFSVILTWCT